MTHTVSYYRLDQLREGREAVFEEAITPALMDGFAALSGDVSPLHVDDAFAQERGFDGRVAHGMILGAFISRLVGVHLPGANALLQSVNLKFLEPVYLHDRLRIVGRVEQVSEAAGAVVLQVTITNIQNDQMVAKAKVQVGFTKPARGEPT